MAVEVKNGRIQIPIEYYGVARENLRKFLRDFAGLRVGGIMPYFTEAAIEACFTDDSNPVDDRNGRLAPDLVFWDDQRPRFAHIDLGISHDAAGLCIAHLEKMERVPFGESKKYGVEFLPFVKVDLIAGFSPILFKRKKIQIKYIIGILLELVQRRGMNLELVTADGYQSAIIFETMEDEGINSGHLSIDNTTTYPVVDGGKVKRVSTKKNGAAAVDCLFTLVDDRRFECPRYDQLSKEGPNLERDEEQSLVYKIPGSTDDVIQAASGAVFNVVNNARESNIEDFVDEKKPQKISEAFPDEGFDDENDDFVSRSMKNYQKFKKKENVDESGDEGEIGSFDDDESGEVDFNDAFGV